MIVSAPQMLLSHSQVPYHLGKVDGEILLDLDYQEDSNAETDMNFIMNDEGNFIEIQGTAEKGAFSKMN